MSKIFCQSCAVGMVAFFGLAAAQPVALSPAGSDPNVGKMPVGIAMYTIFSSAVSREQEQVGSGVRFAKDAIGAKESSRGEAVFAYMRAAFFAGRASSVERTREFCRHDIRTKDDLIDALEGRRSAHNAELERLAGGVEKITTPEEYANLLQYAQTRASSFGFEEVDFSEALGGAIDVSAEVARRCSTS